MSYTTKYLQFLTEARPPFIKPLPIKKDDTGYYNKLNKVITVSKGDVEYTEDGLVKYNYKGLQTALKDFDEAYTERGMGHSTMIYGDAGIGKSSIIESRAKTIAAELGRTFITLDEYTTKFKHISEIQANLESYYIYIDLRVASMDPSMITGVPDPTSPESRGFLTELTLPWVSIMCLSDKSAGMLFLDELNLAAENVQGALYSLLNYAERRIGGGYLVKGNWRIHAAGNWGPGYGVEFLKLAFKERPFPIYLAPDFEGWLNWVNKTKDNLGRPVVHPVVIDFISDDPEQYFYVPPSDQEDPTRRPNPRNYTALSSLLYRILGNPDDFDDFDERTFNRIEKTAASGLGKQHGKEFVQYLRSQSMNSITELLAPENVHLLTVGKGGKESVVAERLAFFKRAFVQYLTNFKRKYENGSEDEKRFQIDMGMNFIGVLGDLITEEESTAINIFQKAVSTKLLSSAFAIVKSTIVDYFVNVAKEPRQAKYINDTIKQVVDIAGGNLNTFLQSGKSAPIPFATKTGNGQDFFDAGDEAEEYEDEEYEDEESDNTLPEINNINALDKKLATFIQQYKTNTLPSYA